MCCYIITQCPYVFLRDDFFFLGDKFLTNFVSATLIMWNFVALCLNNPYAYIDTTNSDMAYIQGCQKKEPANEIGVDLQKMS